MIRRVRHAAAAAGVALAATAVVTVPLASPAGADEALPCVEISVAGRSIEVCEDMVRLEQCPYGSGVVIDVMGVDVPVCFSKINT